MLDTTKLKTFRSGCSWRTPALVAGLSLSAGLSLAAFPATAHAAPAPSQVKTDTALAQTLAAKTQTGWVSVIFKTNAPLTTAQEAQMTALGADIVRRLPIIQSVTVRVPARNLAKLAALPFAAHLSFDGKVEKTDAFTVGSSEANLATQTITTTAPTPPGPGKKGQTNTTTQTIQLTGVGVTVAVVDSGVTPVADFSSKYGDFYNQAQSRLLASVNFSTPLPNAFSSILSSATGSNNSYDPCGHGTHVGGIIAGNGSRSPSPYCTQTFMGIAPQTNLVSVRVLDQNGSSTVSTVLSGLQWVLNNQQAYKIRVVNLSLGHPVGESFTTDPICQAVEALYKAGIVVVCAAGNEGRVNGSTNTAGLDNEGWGTAYGSIQSPANDPYIITVGATKNMDGIRADDKIATYSSRGPSRLDLVVKPDIIAPGNKVVSLDAHNSNLDTYDGGTNDISYSSYVQPSIYASLFLNGNSADYFQLSGTSMAAPVVSGAVALLLQASPNLTPDTVKARLLLSADKWVAPDGTADPLTYGAGYLNIPSALASTAVTTGSAASPALNVNPDGSVTIDMTRAMWGSSLWGTGVLDLRALWGSRAMWGSTSVDMTRAMWGSNTTFAASSTLASSTAPSASRAMWGSSVWGDRAMWGSSTTAVDLTSTAINGE